MIETKCQEVCALGDEIRTYLKEIMCSPNCVDAQTAGEYFDMMKDCAETEAKLREASYYKAVTDAMHETQAMNGFNRRGYMPMMMQKPYVDEYLRDPDQFVDSMNRYGYIDGLGNLSHNYSMPKTGNHYSNYISSRKHYTQTHDPESKRQMDYHAGNHMNEVLMTLRDIWDNADQAHKTRMKTDLQKLIDEMK